VYDQGRLNSCTAHAVAAAIQFARMKEGLMPTFTPSRLFIYYNTRVMTSTVACNCGVPVRDAIKSVGRQGACPDEMWPYDIGRFMEPPRHRCFLAAAHHKAVEYRRMPRDLHEMKGCLASGHPFVFGFSVYKNFESSEVKRTGRVQMPKRGEGYVTGHAVMAVGYDDAQQRFIARNSWGRAWGMDGYFTMPYAYLAEPALSSDFWTIIVTK